MEPWNDLASTLADAVIFFYIYMGMICFAAVMTVVLVITYVKKAKQKKENDDNNKKYIPWRISIIVLIAALVLMLAPMIFVYLYH